MPPVSSQDRHIASPAEPSGAGILILAGSSGRLETERADLFAQHGIRAHAIRWFGGVEQRPVPREVPLELFLEEVERLRADCDRVAVLGTSFGAEAALLTAARTSLDAVVAIAPSSVVWPGVDEDGWSSHWTVAGDPLPWVPFVEQWTVRSDPPEFRGLYEASLDADPTATAAAGIPVERIAGDVILAVGEDDRVWPSVRFADAIVARRASSGKQTTVLRHPDAGHRVPFPGESAPAGGQRMARGGTPAADAALGAEVFATTLRLLAAGRAG